MLEQSLSTTSRRIAATTALALLLGTGSAMAQSMVSVKGSTLNMREGPGTRHPVLWSLSRGYPLQVVKRQGDWLQVKDFEGDGGWVARSLTSSAPHHVVKVPTANLRSGPGTRYRIKGKMEYGETLRTLQKQGQWVKVRHESLGQGWVSRRLVWGW